MDKMKMKHTIFALAMSLFLPATVSAADIDGQYTAHTVAGVIGSCGEYVTARDEKRRAAFLKSNTHVIWIWGYLTAYNRQTPDTYDIMAQTDTPTILLWLDNYCKQNPLTDFAEAMVSLMNELHSSRIRKKPK